MLAVGAGGACWLFFSCLSSTFFFLYLSGSCLEKDSILCILSQRAVKPKTTKLLVCRERNSGQVHDTHNPSRNC